MKVTPDALAAELRKRVAPLYVIAGDEPLLTDECLEAIRAAAETAGCSERELQIAERGFDWQSFRASQQNLSLFASRRLIQLRLPTGKPGDAGAKFLVEASEAPSSDIVLVVLLPALDSATSKSKWATALADRAVWVDVRPPRREQLGAWLSRRVQRAGLTAEPDALDELAARIEGNLLAAKQEIDILSLLLADGRLTASAVRDSVSDGARFDIFQLTDAALAGDARRAMRVLDGLEREGTGAPLVLWSLVRDVLVLADLVLRMDQGRSVDQALAETRVWRSRHDAFRRAVRGRSRADVVRLVTATARADHILKGTRPGDPWRALMEVTLTLAGAPQPLAETA